MTTLEKLLDASYYACTLGEEPDKEEVERCLKRLLPEFHHIEFGYREWAAYDAEGKKIAYAFDNQRTVETYSITY